jgi:pimeloyl-ACP methyl ester carboxylesterase
MPKIKIDDISVNYKKSGKGFPIVFLHGHGGNLHLFDSITKLLSSEFTIYSYDQRGYGSSDKPLDLPYSTNIWANDLHKFVSKLALEEFHLGGHSMSGRISSIYAKNHPEKVKSLVTFNTTWFGSNPKAAENLINTAKMIENKGMEAVIRTSKSLNSIPSNRKDVFEEVKKMLLNNNENSYANGSRAVANDFINNDINNILDAIYCPTLIVIGDRDSAPLEGAATMFSGIKNAQLAVIPGSGHYSLLEKTKILGLILNDFLISIHR